MDVQKGVRRTQLGTSCCKDISPCMMRPSLSRRLDTTGGGRPIMGQELSYSYATKEKYPPCTVRYNQDKITHTHTRTHKYTHTHTTHSTHLTCTSHTCYRYMSTCTYLVNSPTDMSSANPIISPYPTTAAWKYTPQTVIHMYMPDISK